MGSAVAAPRLDAPASTRYPFALAYLCLCCIAGLYLAGLGLPITPVLVAIPFVAGPPVLRRQWTLSLLVVAGALTFAAGMWRLQSTAYHDSPHQIAHYIGQNATIVGVVDGEPQQAGRAVTLTLRVESLASSADAPPIDMGGRLLVHYAGAQQVEYGDRLRLTGRPAEASNPPGFDYRGYLARQGIHAVLSFPGLTVQARNEGNPIQALAFRLRGALRTAIERMLPHDPAALLVGILLGASTKSLGSLTAPFVTVGMIHVVAISGIKVALVAGIVAAICTRLPLRIRWAPASTLVCLYTLVSGATPSGLRSALMWMLALAAIQLGRRSYVWVSLAVVAAAMAAWNPSLLWDTGFQLSVIGTAGIVAFAAPIARRLHWLPALLRESVAVTLAAQIATLPITAASFDQVSLAGPLANGLLLPLLGPIMGLGGFAALVGTVSPPAAHVLAFLVYPLLMVMIGGVRVLAAMPLAAFAAPTIEVWLTVVYYGAGIFLMLLWYRRLRTQIPTFGPRLIAYVRAMPRGLLAGCLAAAVTVPIALAQPPDQPQVTIAGVGGGTVIFAGGPRGQAVLVDGGRSELPLQVLLGKHLPFWQRDLSAVFVTEPDLTHIGGLLALTSLYGVRRAIDAGAIYPSATYASWRAELRDGAVGRLTARTGLRLDFGGDIVVDVLEPAALALDADPAPVAYRLRMGSLALLVLNGEAAGSDPTPLLADGRCLDVAVLPARIDLETAAVVVEALHPRLTVVSQAPDRSASTLVKALASRERGIRIWVADEGHELTLGSKDGHCF